MYNGNLEWALTIRDLQAEPELTLGPQDLQAISQAIRAMQSSDLGEPGGEYDARSVFDSRPTNAFDGIFSDSAPATSGVAWSILFDVPLGFRAAVREFQVNYDAPGSGPALNSTISILLQGSALPFNSDIIIGAGTSDPLEVFFLVEEGGTFGITGTSSNLPGGGTTVYVNGRVNLIPVTLEQLSYAVVNRKQGS
jgi:hypothetical protein